MEQNSKYRWNTKEEQEENWKVGEKFAEYDYNRIKNFREEFNVYKLSGFSDRVYDCYLHMKQYTLLNKLQWAKDEAELGIDIAEHHLSKETKRKNILKNDAICSVYCHIPYFYWFLNEKEDIEQLKKSANAFEYILSEKKKKYYYLNGALANMKYGDFEKAKKHIEYLYKIKPRSRLNENIIYKLENFSAFIIEYLIDKEKNSDMLPKLISCFRFLFDEDKKGSYKLYDENVIDMTKRDYIFGLRYIWYKYFSGRDWDTISPIEVIQSERYGVKGLQDC